MNAQRAGIGLTSWPDCALSSFITPGLLEKASPMRGCPAMTSKMIWSAKSKYSSSTVPARAGRLRWWSTWSRGCTITKKGLKRLLNDILADRVGRLVVTHKDRLLRFGAELVFAICEAKQVEVVILNQGEDMTFEEELAQDVLEIITVFSARLYGSRSRKNQKLLDGVKHAVEETSS